MSLPRTGHCLRHLISYITTEHLAYLCMYHATSSCFLYTQYVNTTCPPVWHQLLPCNKYTFKLYGPVLVLSLVLWYGKEYNSGTFFVFDLIKIQNANHHKETVHYLAILISLSCLDSIDVIVIIIIIYLRLILISGQAYRPMPHVHSPYVERVAVGKTHAPIQEQKTLAHPTNEYIFYSNIVYTMQIEGHRGFRLDQIRKFYLAWIASIRQKVFFT